MPRSRAKNEFVLEELEERVLLSANMINMGAGMTVAQAHFLHTAAEQQSPDNGAQNQSQISDSATDLFAGVAPTSPTSPSTGPGASTSSKTNATETSSQIESSDSAVAINTCASIPSSRKASPPAGTKSSPVTGSIAQQLTETLKSANAPPTSPSSRVDLGSDDLGTFVDDVLAGLTTAENGTFTLNSLTIGNFAELKNVTLKFVNAKMTQTGNGPATYSGLVEIYLQANGYGVLFPGSSFSGTFSGSTSPSMSSSFNLGTGMVTFQATGLELSIANALSISASSLTFKFQYVNANGGYSYGTPNPTQVVSNVSGATAEALEFPLSTATLTNFQIRNDGFSFDGFTLTSSSSSPINFDGSEVGLGSGIFSAGGAAGAVTMTVSAFNVAFSTGQGVQPNMAGSTISLNLPGLQLYPAGGLVQLQYSSINAFYDFSNFDGVDATGALTIAISGFQMNFGQALQISSPSVTIYPEQFDIGSINSARLTSPIISNMTTDTIPDIPLSYSGFSVGDFSLENTSSPVTIGNALSFDSAEIDFSGFGLAYSQSSSGSSDMTGAIQGQVAVLTYDATLFPNIAFVNDNLGDLAGTFNNPSSPATWTGVLSLVVPSFVIPLGDALTLNLGSNVNLQPGNYTMVQPTSASVSANLFSGVSGTTLPGFQITQDGFSLGSFTLSGPNATIGNYLSFGSATIQVNQFAITNASTTPAINGSIMATVNGTELYPGDVNAVFGDSSVTAAYDFSTVASLGTLTLDIKGFTLSIDNEMEVTDGTDLILTPSQTNLGTIASAGLEVMPLNDLSANVSNVVLTQTGFSLNTANGSSAVPDVEVGGALELDSTQLSFSNASPVQYIFSNATSGGTLGGNLMLASTHSEFDLGNSPQGSAIDTTASPLNGAFNLAQNSLTATMQNFQVNLPSFVDIGGANALISFQISSSTNQPVFHVGVSGVSLFLGSGTGSSAVGINITNATLAAAVFPGASNGTATYALQATGTLSLVGFSAGGLTLTGSSNAIVRYNDTGGAVNETVNVDSNPNDAISLAFQGNETSVAASNFSMALGTFATVTGDFGFSVATDQNGNVQSIAVGIDNAGVALNSAFQGIGGIGLSLQGTQATPMQVSLLIVPGATPTYALASTGGNIAVDGIPDLTIVGSNLRVVFNNTGQDPTTLPGGSQSIVTPDGSITLNFAGVGATTIADLQGSISELQVGDILDATGDFGFQAFTTPSGGSAVVIAAENVNATMGTSTAGLTITGASLGLLIVPGSSPAYALISNGGTDTLTGVQGLTLTGTLQVNINTGVDSATLTAASEAVQTPDGSLSLNFSNLSAAPSADIQGTITLAIDNFASITGAFGFQAATDPETGLTEVVAGATNINFTLGTDQTNLSIMGASFALVIAPISGGGAAWGLISNGGTDTLNGVTGLQLTAMNLQVEVSRSLTPDMLAALPDSVQTPQGDVALDFSNVDSGDITAVEGQVMLSFANFVTVSGDFGFQASSETPGGPTEIVVGAQNVNASLSAGGISLTIEDASLALLIIPGSGYALVANGGTDSLNGVDGLTLEATNLIVKFNNTGIDPATLNAASASVITPDGEINPGEMFAGLGSQNITSIQGTLTVAVDGFVSVTGNFGFQLISDPNTGGTDILAAADQISATLGNENTYVSIQGASLALLIVPSTTGGATTYALVANGGTDSLVGIDGLSLMVGSLTVQYNNTGADPTTVVSNSVTVQTSDMQLNPGTIFAGLGSANIASISGSLTLEVQDFVSVSGSFSISQTTGMDGVTQLVFGATNVNAFVGMTDSNGNPQTGVQISNAQLGLVVYLGDETTYALYTSAQITPVGLTSDNITLTGTVSFSVNTTGAAVNQTVMTPGGNVTIAFTDGTNGTPDQTDYVTFGGSISATFQTNTNPITLAGSFVFASATGNGSNVFLIGASGVSATGITTDSGTMVNITNGMLGVAIFSNGYALTASATVSGGGSGGSASGTITLRRNTTTMAVDQMIEVGTVTVQDVFSSSEVSNNGTAFQSFALSNVNVSVDNTLLFVADSISTSNPGPGISLQSAMGAMLTLQDPTTQTAVFTITAGSAAYATLSAGANYDGMTWANGGTDVQLQNISFNLGSNVTFTASAVTIQHYMGSSGEVTNFNFTGASIVLSIAKQTMATITGSIQFSYSSQNGFALNTANEPPTLGFTFFNTSAAGSGGSGMVPGGTGGGGGNNTMLGPISMSAPTISLSNFTFKLVSGQPTMAQLGVTITITVQSASIAATVAGLSLSASLTNLSGAFNLNAMVNLTNIDQTPTLTASGFMIMVGNLSITIGPYTTLSAALTISANNVTLNPTPDNSQPLVTFGGTPMAPGLQATLTIGAVVLSGGAGNFSIMGDGTFVAGNNFFVIFTLGQGNNPNSSQLGWPSWLPLQSATVLLTWPNNNFNANPGSFLIDLSGSMSLTNIQGIPLTIQGTITNAVIDTNLIGKSFPIISITSLSVQVSGTLFGCAINGSLIAGVERFDSTGQLVDGYGNYVSTGKPDPNGPFTSIFYAGINAGIKIANVGGFQVWIGLSQYGPLDIYFSLTVPGGLVLDPTSGLAINNFRGGVTFSGLPSPLSSTPTGTDALNLNQAAFTAPAMLTLQQWQTQLQGQVAAQYMQSLNGGVQNSWTNLSGPVTIKAGVTFYDAYATQSTFRVDGDIFFDTTGKFIVIGTATFLDSVSVTVRMYADLSTLVGPSPPSLTILFLMNMPDATPPATPPLQIYGLLSFNFSRTDGTPVTMTNQANQIKIVLEGGANLMISSQLSATLTGGVTLSFSVTSSAATMQVNLNATLNVTNLGNLASVGGTLTFQINSDGSANLWGALLLTSNINVPLTNPNLKGISFTGTAFFEINTSSQAQTVTVMVGMNPPTTLTLDPQLFSLYLNGNASFTINNVVAFSLSGTLAVAISSSSVTIFVQATLQVGPPGSVLVSYMATGLMYMDSTGFAAMLNLTYKTSGVPGVMISANALLVVNTTLRNITYTIPNPPPTSPPTPAVQTVMGPNFASSNPLAMISYEGPGRTLLIPGGAPPTNQNPASWNVTTTNYYFVILQRGNLIVAINGTGLTLTGAISIVGSFDPNTGQASFSVMANAALNLTISGNVVFSFNVNASLLINNNGLVAYVSLMLGSNAPNIGFSFGGPNLSFTLQLNTTGAAAMLTLQGGGMVTVQPGVMVTVSGSLVIPGVTIQGNFTLAIQGNVLLVSVSGTVGILGLTFNVTGFAGVYDDANPGIALSLSLTIGNNGNGMPTFTPAGLASSVIDISGTFTLQVNTCSVSRFIYDSNGVVTSNSINPGVLVQVTNLNLFLLGFNLTGSISISLTPNGYTINIPAPGLSLSFFDIVTLSLTGYLTNVGNSTTFSFTARGDISLGTSSFGVRGSVSVSFSNANGGSFSASINGEVTAFGISVQAGASVMTDNNRNVTLSIYVSATLFPAINIDFDGPNIPFVGPVPSIHIHTPAVVVSGTAVFALGQLAPPPAPPPPPPALASEPNGGGTLTLNLGANVGSRTPPGAPANLYGAEATEEYSVTSENGEILVTALGITQTFTGVTSIVVDTTNNATTSTILQIDNSVTVPVTVTLGAGNNTISTGGGFATITVSGGGNNIITSPGGASIMVNGGGNNNITVGGAARSSITIVGNGSNSIVTGAGFTAITDNGFGSNSIEVGLGGGSYTENPIGNFLYPTPSRKTTITGNTGNFSVSVSGYSNYQLSNTDLLYSVAGATYNYDLQLQGVMQVTLTTIANGASTVLLSGWTGSATIIGGGNMQNPTTLSISPGVNVTDSLMDILTDTSAQMTFGTTTVTTNLQNVQNVYLIGGDGINSFDVSGWHGGGGLTGAPGTTSVNTLRATDDTSFTLTDGMLMRFNSNDGSTFQPLQLQNINVAYLTGGAGQNVFNIGTSAVFSGGTNSSWSGLAYLTGSGGNDTYNVYFNGMTGTQVKVNDTAPGDQLFVYGSRTITVTPNVIKVLAQRVYYGTAPGNSGGVSTLQVTGVYNPIISNLTYKVVGTNSAVDTTITMTGTPAASLYIGARAGMTPANLSLIQGVLDIIDDITDNIYVTDLTGIGLTGVLTNSTLTGLGMGAAGVVYSSGPNQGPLSLNITLPAAGNTFTILSTNLGTNTILTLGGNNNVVNVGGNPLANGILAGIQGSLTINGSGTVYGTGTTDILNVTDAGTNVMRTGGLTASTVAGLGMGSSITFYNFAAVNVYLGSGGNIFSVSTFPGINGMLENPVQIAPSQLVALYTQFTVTGGTGGDQINVLSTVGPTTINTGGQVASTVNVGSIAPAVGGKVDYILGVLTVNGQQIDTMNVDDTGSTVSKSGTLTSTQINGLGAVGLVPQEYEVLSSTDLMNWTVATMFTTTNVLVVWNDPMPTYSNEQKFYIVYQLVPGQDPIEITPTINVSNARAQLTWVNENAFDTGIIINYFNLSNVNVNLGSGGNEFLVKSTADGTNTEINSGLGNSVVSVQSTTGPLVIITGQNTENQIIVGSLAPVLDDGSITDGIKGALTIIGSGEDTLIVDDSGNDIVRTGTLTSDSLTGFGMGPQGIQFTGLSGEPIIYLGSGDSLTPHAATTVNSTQSSATTSASSNSSGATGNTSVTSSTSSLASTSKTSQAQTQSPATKPQGSPFQSYYIALFRQTTAASALDEMFAVAGADNSFFETGIFSGGPGNFSLRQTSALFSSESSDGTDDQSLIGLR